jgi:1-acyl-sn-glycerol-3-phosphate acyltransferase
MRTLLSGITVAVMTILLAPVAVAAHVLGVFPEERTVQQWCMRTWASTICRVAGARVVLHGAEHIDRARGTVYASNHVSWFDIFALAMVLPKYTFVAKAELRRIPIFGWGAEGAGVIFLSRENRKSAFEAYESVAAEIARGRSVVVCPEGTRGDDYHLRPFKKGPFVLAIAAKAPVVPTVVHGAREVMRRGSWTVRPGTVHVHLLPPVETEGFDYERRDELMTRVWTPMAELLEHHYHIPIQSSPLAVTEMERQDVNGE